MLGSQEGAKNTGRFAGLSGFSSARSSRGDQGRQRSRSCGVGWERNSSLCQTSRALSSLSPSDLTPFSAGRKKGTELQPGRLLTPGARGEEWHPPPKLNSVSTPVISKKQKLSSSRRRAIQTHLEVPGGNPSSLGEENERKLKALPLGKGRNACCLTFHDAWRKATSPTLMVTVPAKTRRKQNASDPLPNSPAASLTSTK